MTPEYKNKRGEALQLDTTDASTLYLYPEEASMG